jgi:hypothetical protein
MPLQGEISLAAWNRGWYPRLRWIRPSAWRAQPAEPCEHRQGEASGGSPCAKMKLPEPEKAAFQW